MTTASLLHITGWSAYISAAATILTFLTGILFFTMGQSFGRINDISSVVQIPFMMPLTIGLYRLVPSKAQRLGLSAVAVGVSGMLISVVGQSLPFLDRIDPPASLKFFPAGGIAIGIWLVYYQRARANTSLQATVGRAWCEAPVITLVEKEVSYEHSALSRPPL